MCETLGSILSTLLPIHLFVCLSVYIYIYLSISVCMHLVKLISFRKNLLHLKHFFQVSVDKYFSLRPPKSGLCSFLLNSSSALGCYYQWWKVEDWISQSPRMKRVTLCIQCFAVFRRLSRLGMKGTGLVWPPVLHWCSENISRIQ